MTVRGQPSYSDLFVVSDLHLGGKPEQQIFCQGTLLAALIDLAGGQLGSADGRVGLVLAGDIVDFLAEPGQVHFKATPEALGCLERIVEDPAFKPVFLALRRFVRQPNHELILFIGNHDLELALPEVQQRLTELICGFDENGASLDEATAAAARGRLRLIMDVTGLRCRVGTAQVLCLHGNEVDEWNRVAPGKLTEVCASATRKATEEPWIPNAGTQLVIDVMNPIKERFPFVDLLKPEDEVVIPVLMAIDPGIAKKASFSSIPGIGARLVRDSVGRWFWLGEGEGGEASPAATDPAAMAPAAVLQDSASDLLSQAQSDSLRGRAPLDLLVQSGMSGESLGSVSNLLGYYWSRIAQKPPEEALREGLRSWLKNDRTYSPGQADDTFKRIDALVDPAIDVVIAGHTHLARALPRSRGGKYYNAGTWIRLIRLDEAKLATATAFEPVYKALGQGTMAALDACPGLIYHRATVVRVRQQGNQTESGLYQCDFNDQTLQLSELTTEGSKESS